MFSAYKETLAAVEHNNAATITLRYFFVIFFRVNQSDRKGIGKSEKMEHKNTLFGRFLI